MKTPQQMTALQLITWQRARSAARAAKKAADAAQRKYIEFNDTCHDYPDGPTQRRMMNKRSRLFRVWCRLSDDATAAQAQVIKIQNA